MKLSTKVRTWLADRSTVVNHPRLYRKPPSAATGWREQRASCTSWWDATLVLLAAVILLCFGFMAFAASVLFIAAIVTG